MPDLLLVDNEAAAGLSGRRDAEGFVFRRHDIVTRVGGEGKRVDASARENGGSTPVPAWLHANSGARCGIPPGVMLRVEGGAIVLMFNDYIDATGDKVGGWVDDPNGELMGGHALTKCWLNA